MLPLSALGGATPLALTGAVLSSAITAAAVGLGLVAAIACLLPSRRTSPVWLTALALVVSAGSGLWFGSDASLPFHAPQPPTDRVLEHPSEGYVTSNDCRACHPGQYATWHESYHSTMTQVVEPGTVQATFEGDLRVRGRDYRLERRGDEYYGSFPVDSPGGESSESKTVRLTQVTGSHHMQVFWYSFGDQRGLGMFPLYFHLEEQRWIPWSSVFLMRPEFHAKEDVGRWNTHCVKCHTTDARSRMLEMTPAATAAAETEVGEYGISCEACHGPGDVHAGLNRNPLRRYLHHFSDSADDSIVHPTRLDAETSAHVCAQCHSVHALLPKQFERAQEFGNPYRPGDDLEASQIIYGGRRKRGTEEMARSQPDFVRNHFWSDGMVRVGGREFNGLQRSPCYTHGDPERGVMTCSSCHSAHRFTGDGERPAQTTEEWADDQLGPDMRSNQSCLQCHGELTDDAALTHHTRHSPTSSGSSCTNCHMPHTTWGLMKATRSHEISSPSVQVQLDTGRPNACSMCHLDRSLGWVNNALVEGFGASPVAMGADDRDLPVAVVAALRGDAGQRALVAWAMGWEPALQASGSGWMERLLATLMIDTYDVVRFNAMRALRLQPGYESMDPDFLADEGELERVRDEILERWRAQGSGVQIPDDLHDRLLQERDLTPLYLSE